MSKLFNTVQLRKPKKSAFDLSHEKKLSMNMGDLVPVYLQEVVPGDIFKNVSTEFLIRLAPMIAPVMHRVNAYVHYFFVPNRLVWDNWEKFITGGVDGKDTTVFPTFEIDNSLKNYTTKGSLADYLGLPDISSKTVTQTMSVNALPFRAYQLIYNEYYRDQTLMTAIDFGKDHDGPRSGSNQDLLDSIVLRKRCWEKDYFTSALPWVQRGDDVLLPNTINYDSESTIVKANGTQPTAGNLQASNSYPNKIIDGSGSASLRVENIDSLEITINDLRTSSALQRWLEKNALGGSRYVEQILAHFGVRLQDYKAHRPVYLGGGKTPIVISEVLANFTDVTNSIPQGNMAGHGVGVGNTNTFSETFYEHGYVFGIMSVLPRTTYHQGVDRSMIKTSRFDFYFPEFANLGEQPVYSKEVYFDAENNNNNDVFGYQSRYAEYKFRSSSVHGDFKDDLDFWHMGRIFTSHPHLNSSFVEADPTTRIFAVDDYGATNKLYVQLYNKVHAIRPMPFFASPKIG